MRTPPSALWPDADRQMWGNLLTAVSLLDDGGELAHLRPTTIQMLQQAYRQWVHWLRTSDPLALEIRPAERASLERLRHWLESMVDLRPMTRLFYTDAVLKVLRAANPNGDWAAQHRLLQFLKVQAGSGDRGRKAGRVLDSRVLYESGVRYATTPMKQAPTPLETACRFQTGTMIAMLSLMPLRSSTFRRLALGHSVHVTDGGIDIAVPGDMMKSGVYWEASVPDSVLPMLKRYLEEYRPWLLQRSAKSHKYLWVTRDGEPFRTGYFGVRIALAVREATGIRVSPHLFRDAAATTVARHSPASTGLITPVLAHSSPETAEKHYIHAGSIEAGRDYVELLRNKRRQT
jgi:integrase